MDMYSRAHQDIQSFLRVRLHTEDSLRRNVPFPSGPLATYDPLVTLKVEASVKVEALLQFVYQENVGCNYHDERRIPCLFWVDSEPWVRNKIFS